MFDNNQPRVARLCEVTRQEMTQVVGGDLNKEALLAIDQGHQQIGVATFPYEVPRLANQLDD